MTDKEDKILYAIAVGIARSVGDEEDKADELFEIPDALHMLRSVKKELEQEFEIYPKK